MPRSALRWSVALGFALGGFFDGILLHQILQWHHLLSLVPGVEGIGAQVLWDGVFHAAMYVIAAVALWALWRAERRGGALGGARRLGALLLGFGLWHVVDTLLSHWILGIHRIRVDSANPLAWDLLWLALFGLGPMAVGWALLRRGGPPGRPGRAFAMLSILTLGAGAWSLRPPAEQPYAVAVFRPGLSPERIEAELAALGAKMVWAGPRLDVAVLDLAPERRWSLYGRGALMVGGTGIAPGCLGWSRAPTA